MVGSFLRHEDHVSTKMSTTNNPPTSARTLFEARSGNDGDLHRRPAQAFHGHQPNAVDLRIWQNWSWKTEYFWHRPNTRPNYFQFNSKIKNPDATKMCEMVEEISSFRERFRAEEIVELVLYQPHPTGWTPLHVSSLLNNSHATQLLLEHGANPYVQDTEHFSITQYSHSIHTVSIILYQILWFSSPLRAQNSMLA